MTLKKIKKLENLVEVPEDILMNALVSVSEEEKAEIAEELSAYTAFKDAGMTPYFIMDTSTYEIFCVARETFGKKLH